MALDSEQLEQLLSQEEGHTLDFKQNQYQFERADDADKGELMKDILAFANTTRKDTAYILVGVKEVKGRCNEVVGVDRFLDDARVQQFVNSKTQRPVVFSYQYISIGNRTIGVIEIPVQPRPIHLKKNFGRLVAEKVYLRRGSSTDVASPDEIAQMGNSNRTNKVDVSALVYSVTNQYVKDMKRQLINNSIISRSESETLLSTLTDVDASVDCVVTGTAGSGKTTCILECVNALRQYQTAVLAFRLDRVSPVSSTKKLGEDLGLGGSPVSVLKDAAEVDTTEAVLILDQLDAVSTTSGRNVGLFEVVEALLEEVRECRGTIKCHVVLACRKFDWENDHRLRRPLADNHVEVPIGDFSPAQVKFILQNGGFDTDLFSKSQLELLGLPQNMTVFLDANPDFETRPNFATNKDLFDEYWVTKQRAVNARTNAPDHWTDIIWRLCDEMSASQQLSVMKEELDRFPKKYVEVMASEGVLSYR